MTCNVETKVPCTFVERGGYLFSLWCKVQNELCLNVGGQPSIGEANCGRLALEPPTADATIGALLGWRLKMKRKKEAGGGAMEQQPP
jgi:hypothetical protein